MSQVDAIIPVGRIEQRILLIRGQRIILDADLASFYGVETKRLNEQVKRNRQRVRDSDTSLRDLKRSCERGSDSHLTPRHPLQFCLGPTLCNCEHVSPS